jgi:hypothetical protein
MTPEEEFFEELLSRLKNASPYPHNAVVETPADHLTPRDVSIWIMESKEIFYQGRLKGRKKVTGTRNYNSHSINNLETLVEEAALILLWWLDSKKFKSVGREGITDRIAGKFDRLLQSYDAMAEDISLGLFFEKPPIKEKAISDYRKVIEGWKMRAMKNIKPRIDEADIKNDLAKLFITHVPEAPSERIAKCVSVLLSAPPFNVEVNIETFRKDVKKLKEDIEDR